MIKTAVKRITPPILLDFGRLVLGGRSSQSDAEKGSQPSDSEGKFEYVDFYGNTSLFALEVLQRHGTIKQMRLFSLGNRMAHVADYLALFGTVYLSTWLKTHLPVASERCPSNLVMMQGDFFELPSLEVDCVISQAAIHCLNDTRYGNDGTNEGWRRPYQAAAKLREIIGNGSIPIVVSIAVAHTESFIDDNARLGHDKFVESFVSSGFTLQEHFFDYLCYGLPQRPEYFETHFRRAKLLPAKENLSNEYNYVIGNYYFL